MRSKRQREMAYGEAGSMLKYSQDKIAENIIPHTASCQYFRLMHYRRMKTRVVAHAQCTCSATPQPWSPNPRRRCPTPSAAPPPGCCHRGQAQGLLGPRRPPLCPRRGLPWSGSTGRAIRRARSGAGDGEAAVGGFSSLAGESSRRHFSLGRVWAVRRETSGNGCEGRSYKPLDLSGRWIGGRLHAVA